MTIVLITIAFYLVATALLVAGVRRDASPARHWLLPALAAVALHAAAHVLAWRDSGSADMHFFAALSLVGLGMAALTTLVGALGRMAALGVVVFPLAAPWNARAGWRARERVRPAGTKPAAGAFEARAIIAARSAVSLPPCSNP